ncbi:putative alcohol dehydrogenase [Actinomyces howellii]|uniref:Putative alcohol dehydrogenase n=1 Tax=Actinomyces howellii TaxID=52771 RepID=A0A448HKL0_9ACTO|nr:putative alcohol dehydrogenase [Actinomyces howellii]
MSLVTEPAPVPAPATMRAAVLRAPGIDNLVVTDLPVPEPGPGQVRLKVLAFGLNRSEYHSVTGLAEGMSFPRVLGIEAAGLVDLDPEGLLPHGTQAATMMGGMGRIVDGGYAQYVVVPRSQVITFSSDLPWEVIGSLPETLQTAHGSLTTGLDLRPGQSLLVRGGTSALGLAVAALAADAGCRVLSTSRRPEGVALLESRGLEGLHDTGTVNEAVRDRVPGGVDAVLELVGTPHPARLPGGHRGARHRVLHRDALGHLDYRRLLPHRLDPQRGASDRLFGPGPRPSGHRAPAGPGQDRRRGPRPHADALLPARGDRPRPPGPGRGQAHRQARRAALGLSLGAPGHAAGPEHPHPCHWPPPAGG